MGGIIGTEQPTEGPIWTMMNDTHSEQANNRKGCWKSSARQGGTSEPGDLFV